jgi:hypothetical protein
MKSMKMRGSPRTKTVACNLDTLWVAEREDLRERLRGAVIWVSKMKARASLFLNWHLLRVVRDTGIAEIPIITKKTKEAVFTSVFAAIAGRRSPLSGSYQEFCRQTGYSTIGWIDNNSKVLTYAKQEMATVTKTAITTHFFTRRLKFVRWTIANTLREHLLSIPQQKDRKHLLWRISTVIMAGLDVDAERLGLPPELGPVVQSMVDREKEMLEELRAWVSSRCKSTWVGNKVKDSVNENSKRPPDKQKPIKTAEEVSKEFDELSPDRLVDLDPLATIPYFYMRHQQVEEMELSVQWRECVQAQSFEQSWPWWKTLRYPVGTFSPVPYYRTSRQFIRIDQSVLEQWKVEMDPNKWWMCSLLELYDNKRCRIPDLRKWRHLDNPLTAEACIAAEGGLRESDRPCVPGGTFLTDGVAAHITLVTTPTHHLHLDGLSQAGYKGIPQAQAPRERTPIGASCRTTGVVKLESCEWAADAMGLEAVAVDPGVIQVVTHASIKVQDLLENREDAVRAALETAEGCSEDWYVQKSGRADDQKREAMRRMARPSYSDALEALQGTRRKSFSLDDVLEYARARRRAEPGLEAELHDIARSAVRRTRFVRTQKCMANLAHQVLRGDDRKPRRIAKKRGQEYAMPARVVFFGRGSWGGIRGHVSVPRKSLIRQLASRALVVLVDEHCTSKLCPLDFTELCSSDNPENRIRQCQTANHGEFSADRDVIGSVNIGQKAVYELSGRRLGVFYRISDDV